MKYFKQYKYSDEPTQEIAKDEAKRTLEGWWKDKYLDDIFDNDKSFRLWTSYAEIWTQTDDGIVPMAGFFGVVE